MSVTTCDHDDVWVHMVDGTAAPVATVRDVDTKHGRRLASVVTTDGQHVPVDRIKYLGRAPQLG